MCCDIIYYEQLLAVVMTKSFALGDHFERFIDRQVKGGRFNNASEVVRAGLRLLEDSERRRVRSGGDIRAMIAEADRSKVRIPLDEAFVRLEKRFGVKARPPRRRK
jgi:antitoxin ParD1/3/4